MSPEIIASVSGAVQPLVFETGLDEAPYSIYGTVFLVGFQGRAFILTARHNLTLSGKGTSPLCIFPNDHSQRILPLQDVFFMPQKDIPEDFADFAIIEIDPSRLDSETSEAILIDCAKASGDWYESALLSRYFVLGYPSEHSFVDYKRDVVAHGRVALTGKYVNPSEPRHLHELDIDDSKGLNTFSGFSGGPVFSWIEEEPGRGKIAWCGMVVRGAPVSRRMHFVDREILLAALKIKCQRGAMQ